jgi:hypothetical protein
VETDVLIGLPRRRTQTSSLGTTGSTFTGIPSPAYIPRHDSGLGFLKKDELLAMQGAADFWLSMSIGTKWSTKVAGQDSVSSLNKAEPVATSFIDSSTMLTRIFHTQTKKIFGSQRSTELGHRAHRGKNNDLHSVSKRRLETKIPHTLCAPSVSVSELCALCDSCLGWFGCEIFGLRMTKLCIRNSKTFQNAAW